MTQIFEKLGIHGLKDQVENAMLASMYLGDACLLIGPPGTAKTETIEMIGTSLREYTKKAFPDNPEKWFKFQVYDSSKLNFEDLIGLINPEMMKQGKIDFIHTPTTIWEKVMVGFDEFNRIDPDRQANLFEILRSRKCMGHDTGVRIIFNAMNPYGDTGTNVLSDALVDRHMFFVDFPAFNNMDTAIRSLIINRIGRSDGPGTRYWSGKTYKFDVKEGTINTHLAEIGEKIWKLLQLTGDIVAEIEPDIGPKVTTLIDKCLNTIEASSGSKTTERHFLFSGRRAGLLRRGLVTYRAIEIAKSRVFPEYKLGTLQEAVVQSFMYGMPFGISGSDEPAQVEALKAKAMQDVLFMWKNIDENGFNGVDTLYELFTSRSLLRRMEILLSSEVLEKTSKMQAWNQMISEDQQKSGVINTLLSLICSIKEDLVPANARAILKPMLVRPDEIVKKMVLRPHLSPYSANVASLLKEADESSPIVGYFITESIRSLNDLKEANSLSEGFILEELRTISRTALVIANKVKVAVDSISVAKDNKKEVTDGRNNISTPTSEASKTAYI